MEFREKEHELDSQMQNLRSDLKAAKENAETAAKLSANDAERKYGAILSEKELEIAKLHEQDVYKRQGLVRNRKMEQTL